MSVERIGGYEVHPAASIFPLMQGEAFTDLVADVRKRGLQISIVVVGSKILDGRNRLRACLEANVEPRFLQYEGPDPIGHVISLNLTRRHMSESQRAMVAAKVATMRQGARTDLASIDAKSAEASQNEAARLLNVSRPSVQRARRVAEKAVPEAVAAVESGSLSVAAAASLADLPADAQREVLERAGGNGRAVSALVRDAKGLPPTPTRPRDPAFVERDAHILAIYQGEGGGSVGETARITGIRRHAVQDAVRRAGLSRVQKAAQDPLRGFVENASASAFGWRMALDLPAWDQATDEQISEALAALEEAVAAGRRLAAKVRKMRMTAREEEE